MILVEANGTYEIVGYIIEKRGRRASLEFIPKIQLNRHVCVTSSVPIIEKVKSICDERVIKNEVINLDSLQQFVQRTEEIQKKEAVDEFRKSQAHRESQYGCGTECNNSDNCDCQPSLSQVVKNMAEVLKEMYGENIEIREIRMS